jgi:hypothetical protein
MQKFLAAALIGASLSLTALNASAQHYYVRDRPHEHVITRPTRPDAQHVWIGTEWHWNNDHYEEVPGHWDMPPNSRRVWVAGHWIKQRRGSYWVAGHWS